VIGIDPYFVCYVRSGGVGGAGGVESRYEAVDVVDVVYRDAIKATIN
jgi:hypothetical protein